MRYLFLFLSIVTLAVCLLTSHANAVSADEKLSQADTDSLSQLEKAIERAPKDGNLWVKTRICLFLG